MGYVARVKPPERGLNEIKCTDEVVYYLYFLCLGLLVLLMDVDTLNELSQHGGVQRLQVRVLLGHGHKVTGVGLFPLTFVDVPA